MPGQTAPRARRFSPLLIVLLFAVAAGAVLMAQETAAERVGGFIGGLWVSTMGAVMNLVAAVFGG